ncbi:MAG: hypothetical protein WAU01_06245, partial [Saprospiraceae bacterium]
KPQRALRFFLPQRTLRFTQRTQRLLGFTTKITKENHKGHYDFFYHKGHKGLHKEHKGYKFYHKVR